MASLASRIVEALKDHVMLSEDMKRLGEANKKLAEAVEALTNKNHELEMRVVRLETWRDFVMQLANRTGQGGVLTLPPGSGPAD